MERLAKNDEIPSRHLKGREDFAGFTPIIDESWSMFVKYHDLPAQKIEFYEALDAFGRPSLEDMLSAVEKGDLPRLKRLEQEGGPIHKYLLCHAVGGDCLEIVQYLWPKYDEYDRQVQLHSQTAIAHGRLEVLEFLWEKGYVIDDDSFRFAVDHGRLQIVKWFWEKGFRSDDYFVMTMAATRGYLEMVQWLVENGFPRKDFLIFHAVSSNRFEVVKWLWTSGHPCCDVELQIICSENYSPEITEWLNANPRD